MQTVDAIIVGGGPAGLAAALALSRVQRSVKLFDSSEYRNAAAHNMHTVTLADGMPPSEYRRKAWQEIEAYNVAVLVRSQATSAKQTDEGFAVTDSKGTTHNSRKLILASGVKDIYPDIPGFAELWGKSIIHCAFCHGYETKGTRIGILSGGMAIHIASGAMFTPFATSQYPLTVLLNGKDRSAHEPQLSAMLAKGVQLVETAVARLEPLSSDRGIRIHFVDVARDPLELDYLVYGAPTQQRSTELVASLGLSLDGMGNIVTSGLFQAASTKGVFAAGDAAVMAKAVPSATATGMAAGVGVAHELMLEDYGMAMPAFPSAPSPVEKKEAINAAASSGHPAASE